MTIGGILRATMGPMRTHTRLDGTSDGRRYTTVVVAASLLAIVAGLAAAADQPPPVAPPPAAAAPPAATPPPPVPPPSPATSPTSATQPAKFSTAQLEQLVAPIALYPDQLAIQVMIAATYPLEIVEADRWRAKNPKLQGEELDKALQGQDWDPSVQSLTRLPDLL